MNRQNLLVALALLLVAAGASADLRIWSPTPTVPDANDLGIWPGQDIYTGMWYAYESGYHYFRLDLEMAPSVPQGYPNYSEVYGIYLNAWPGGADGAAETQSFVPDFLSGIDYILDMHWAPGAGFTATHYHAWDAGSSAFSTVAFHPSGYGITHMQANGGKSLQWRIADTGLGHAQWFLYTGATHTPYYTKVGNYTWDHTATACIPEPGSLALFGLGLVGATFLRRRRGR